MKDQTVHQQYADDLSITRTHPGQDQIPDLSYQINCKILHQTLNLSQIHESDLGILPPAD